MFAGSDEPCPCAVIPWECGDGAGMQLLSQDHPGGCVPHPVLPAPAAPAVASLDP